MKKFLFSFVMAVACVFGVAHADITYTVTLSNAGTLPAGYTQLQYIEGTGPQRIDTERRIRGTDIVEMEYSDVVRDGSDSMIFDAYNGSNSMGFNFYRNSVLLAYFHSAAGTIVSGVNNPEGRHTIKIGRNKFYVDDVLKLTWDRSEDFATPKNAFIFSAPYSVSAKVYRYRVTQYNGKIVQNLVPARRDSDGEIGMYDTVTDTFFTNSGTDAFVAGPDVTSYTYGIGTTIDYVPARSGYTFAGWCTDAELQSCAMTQTIGATDTGNKTFYAKWTPDTFNVTWGGVSSADVSANDAGTWTYGGNIRTPRSPEVPGKVFNGWKIRKPKNLIDPSFMDNSSYKTITVNGVTTDTAKILPTENGKTYTLSATLVPEQGKTYYYYLREIFTDGSFRAYNEPGVQCGYMWNNFQATTFEPIKKTCTFTARDNATYLVFFANTASVSTVSLTEYQMEEGSTATPYEPYGNAYVPQN